jgi:hypothetical protein
MYEKFLNVCERMLTDQNTYENFKNNPDFTYVLEHPNYDSFGKQFLSYINEKAKHYNVRIPWNLVCLNDRIGNPEMFEYQTTFDKTQFLSPTTLRYVLACLNIFPDIKKWYGGDGDKSESCDEEKGLNIVEIGGGYGGQCLITFILSSLFNVQISSYTIFDLEPVSKIQEKYLNDVSKLHYALPMDKIHFKTYHENMNLEHKDCFLISNYCLGEVKSEVVRVYFDKLFDNISHGYMSWNINPVPRYIINRYPFLNIKPETPQTGWQNLEIRF